MTTLTEPLTPTQAEDLLHSLISEITDAQFDLRDARMAETTAEIAYKKARVMPARTSPLRAVTPLSRTTALRAVSAKRQAVNRTRRLAVATLAEAGEWCAWCGRSDVPLAGHERLARSQGGDPTRPDMLLCHVCNTRAEDEPRLAAELGFKVSRKWGGDAA